MTINLIDRYLEVRQVTRDELQLVGVTAMLIACKYEEIWPPQIKDYVYMCDKAYRANQIVEMEIDMLTVLDFNVDFISAHCFLERYRIMVRVDDTTFHMA